MARGNNYSVQHVLQRLRTDQLDDSCDEEEETDLQDEDFIPLTLLQVNYLTVIQTAMKTFWLHHLLLH